MGHRPESGAAPADYVVVGANHKTSSVTLRDRLFVEGADVPALLARLRTGGFNEAIIVSTCDRVEVHGAAVDPVCAAAAGRDLLASRAGGYEGLPGGAIFDLTGDAAVRHVFAVAASLESVVVGEAEVLGQIKAAHAKAAEGGGAGTALESLMQQAYAAAKKVRAETAIAEGPVSMAAAAVKAAGSLFGRLENVSALLVGPSEMGILMVDHFRGGGLRRVTVAARNASRAAALAQIVDGHSVTYDDIPDALVDADLVIGAAGLGRHMITAEMLRAALRARRRKPVFVLDVAIPGDADPRIADLDDVFLYDLDNLEAIARSNRDMRDAAMQAAWAIVDDHVDAFRVRQAEREAVPVVAELRTRFGAVRDTLLTEYPRADAEEATRRLINRLLHEPSAALREAARTTGAENPVAETARRLFALADNQSDDDTERREGRKADPSGSED
ncbi:MAG: glutamyl-tRNA reductase [Rhodospirillaceae bacterium]|nr:glutamyl-tRNA reductase [Rhodospirillaceae bacterium]